MKIRKTYHFGDFPSPTIEERDWDFDNFKEFYDALSRVDPLSRYAFEESKITFTGFGSLKVTYEPVPDEA